MSIDAVGTWADFPFALSELLTILPGYALCLMQAWEVLAWERWRALAGAAALALASAAMAAVCTALALPANAMLLPVLVMAGLGFWRLSGVGLFKTLFVIGTAAYVCSFISYLAIVADALIWPAADPSCYLRAPGILVQWTLWAIMLAATAKPIRKVFPELLANTTATHGFWNIAWIPSFIVTAMTVFSVPIDPQTLLVNRVGLLAVAVTLAAFAFMILVYAILYRLAADAEAAARTETERRDLATRELQVEHLEERMAEARRARHDERQHFHALRTFAEAGDLDSLLAYLDEMDARRGSADIPIHYCANPVANAIAVYYLDRLRSIPGAPVLQDIELEMPAELGVPYADLSIVLGNLLENAVEALEAQHAGDRWIRVRTRVAQDGTLFLTLDNSCGHHPRRDASGAYLSSKHDGAGIGLSSVAAVISQHGGTLLVEPADDAFRVSVMLPR